VIKVLVAIHKKPGMSRQEFVRYWREVHAPLAEKMPGVRRYVINPAIEAPGRGEPSFDGLAELWFDDVAAWEAALASPAGRETSADVAEFAQPDKMLLVVAEEIAIVP
jgi:uncharacterized protein (TIGR02118 family)